MPKAVNNISNKIIKVKNFIVNIVNILMRYVSSGWF